MSRRHFSAPHISPGFTLVEFGAVLAAIGLVVLVVFFVMSRVRAKQNDEVRLRDIGRIMNAYRAAADKNLSLCTADGRKACGAGTRVADCRIFDGECGSAPRDVTASYLGNLSLHDPRYSKACPVDGRGGACDYTIVSSAKKAAGFQIRFSTEGGSVDGLAAGNDHHASSRGIDQ